MNYFGDSSFSSLVNTIGMRLVLIPAGSFMMGSPQTEPGRYDDEIYHKVTISKPFYISATVVTQSQWFKLIEKWPLRAKSELHELPIGDAYPIAWISWRVCAQFIQAINKREGTDKYRLPTEAEWEYACRAGTSTALANGDIEATPLYRSKGQAEAFSTNAVDYGDPNLDLMGWDYGNAENRVHRVAKKAPNKWGLYDMHGNVSEWCQDWYGDYPASEVVDPVGPGFGEKRVIRGGSYKAYARDCRSAARFWGWPNVFRGGPDNGLRLVRSV
ncbi:MAG: formylglycine-generating enzyme family protein [Deltaproteobacteria bacterium]|nr:formylglycine-generating enzyme family protein [Deltaproteobacteria bacterium]